MIRATPSSTDINDNFNIYYGVSVSPTMPVGTYKMIPDTNNSNNDGTIVYTATISEDCMKYTVHFNPSSYFEGNLITGTGTMSDQSMFEGVSTALTSNGFTAPTISGTQYYFAGWNTAQDGSGITYTNGQSVTDLATAGNTITLYAMWANCPGRYICYDVNNQYTPSSLAASITGGMGDQIIEEEDATSITLWAPNYKYKDASFVSWNTKPDGSGIDYGPNQTIKFTAGQYNASGLRLYARWIASEGQMQNWSGCSGMNTGDVTALKDTRDNNVYAVAKLADGKCWTIENLRLDDSAELSSTNTHNPSLPLNNSWYYKDQQGTLTTSNHLSATTDPTTTAWCHTYTPDCIDQSMLATNNTTLFTDNLSSSYDAEWDVYSYGNYYNWYSATAGYGNFSHITRANYTASGDICPIGWRLPIGKYASSDFRVLDVAMGGTGADQSTAEASNRWRSYPNNYVYSGYVLGSRIWDRNVIGEYWTSSSEDGNTISLLLYDTSVVPFGFSADSYYGRSVRCVAGT